jgi:hypothetical protein
MWGIVKSSINSDLLVPLDRLINRWPVTRRQVVTFDQGLLIPARTVVNIEGQGRLRYLSAYSGLRSGATNLVGINRLTVFLDGIEVPTYYGTSNANRYVAEIDERRIAGNQVGGIAMRHSVSTAVTLPAANEVIGTNMYLDMGFGKRLEIQCQSNTAESLDNRTVTVVVWYDINI